MRNLKNNFTVISLHVQMSNGLAPFGNLEIVGNGFIEPTLNEKAA